MSCMRGLHPCGEASSAKRHPQERSASGATGAAVLFENVIVVMMEVFCHVLTEKERAKQTKGFIDVKRKKAELGPID